MTDQEFDRKIQAEIANLMVNSEKIQAESQLIQKDISKHNHKTYMPLIVAGIGYMGILTGVLGAVVAKLWAA